MKLKYEQFWFENQIYNFDVLWDLYKKDNGKAINKYYGKIYCPMCLEAPLYFAGGDKRHYLRTADNNLHAEGCPYGLDEASNQEVKDFYIGAADEDIRSRLRSCMNYLFKSTVRREIEALTNKNVSVKCPTFLTLKTNRGRYVHLPHKSLNCPITNSDIGAEKLFYGKCHLYWHKNEKRNYLKVLGSELKEICSIKITESVFKYLPENIRNIPISKEAAEEYYICFFTNLEKREKANAIYYNGTLHRSDHILIGKCQ